jgi:hypothetical protein
MLYAEPAGEQQLSVKTAQARHASIKSGKEDCEEDD